jgi:phosphoesterase RecJ-like protein
MSAKIDFTKTVDLINDSKKIVVIQGENPDGDSLGSSLALEEILGNLGKEVTMFCATDIARHLRHMPGWDRVSSELDTKSDLAIIVDTTSDVLVSKIYEVAGGRHFLETRPVIVLDHHGQVESTLNFEHELIIDPDAVATGELIYNLAKSQNWEINSKAAEFLAISILSDSLGLTTQATTSRSIRTYADLVDLGVSPNDIEMRRREMMKKSAKILKYKGELLGRIEYFLENKLALVHIPWDDIREYSDAYNPSMLVLDEMRLVEGVEIAIAIKTYPDGKLTGKLRCNTPIADKIAGHFGGGGHPYSAGFRVYESYENVISELTTATSKLLEEYHHGQDVTES